MPTPSGRHGEGQCIRLQEAREKTRLGVSTAALSITDNARSVRGTREGPEPGEGLAEAGSSWGQAQLPAPTPDKERPGPGELAAFPPLGAPGVGGKCSRAGRRGLCLTPPLPPPARPQLGNP